MTSMIDKLTGKKPKKKEYKAEILDKPVPITKVKVSGKDNPEPERRTQPSREAHEDDPDENERTVPLLAKYDEAQIMTIQILQEILDTQKQQYELLKQQTEEKEAD